MPTLSKWLLALALMSTGCQSAVIKTPPGFVDLEEKGGRYAYRATTADGLVLAVRVLDDQPEGTLEFWSKAIENELRQRAGYALLETKDVKTNRGLSGKQLVLAHDQDQVPHSYLVTLFVSGRTVYLIEFGGKKDLVTANEKDLAQTISEFSP